MLTVVTGAPCSGKSTHIRTHAQPGDIVIDFDLLCQALGSPSTHDHPEPIRRVARTMRTEAILAAVAAHRRGATVWIVDGNTTMHRKLYASAGARLVVLRVDVDELHRRATAERPERWHALIDEWLAAHGMATSGSC